MYLDINFSLEYVKTSKNMHDEMKPSHTLRDLSAQKQSKSETRQDITNPPQNHRLSTRDDRSTASPYIDLLVAI